MDNDWVDFAIREIQDSVVRDNRRLQPRDTELINNIKTNIKYGRMVTQHQRKMLMYLYSKKTDPKRLKTANQFTLPKK